MNRQLIQPGAMNFGWAHHNAPNAMPASITLTGPGVTQVHVGGGLTKLQEIAARIAPDLVDRETLRALLITPSSPPEEFHERFYEHEQPHARVAANVANFALMIAQQILTQSPAFEGAPPPPPPAPESVVP